MNGILFTPSNHQLIRDLKKVETRRLAGLEKVNEEPDRWQVVCFKAELPNFTGAFIFHSEHQKINCKPRYHEGEEVCIKEVWRVGSYAFKKYAYIQFRLNNAAKFVLNWNDWLTEHTRYGGSLQGDEEWRSPLFMPAWAARDFLLMLKVFPQRARDITPEQAVAEGFATPKAWGAEINARNPKEKPWDNNLWLFAYQFRLIRKDGVEL